MPFEVMKNSKRQRQLLACLLFFLIANLFFSPPALAAEKPVSTEENNLQDSLHFYAAKADSMRKSNPDQSQHAIRRMLDLQKSNKEPDFMQQVFIRAARAFYMLKQFDSAIKYTDQASGLIQEVDNTVNQAEIYMLYSDINYYLADFAKGIDYAGKALELYEDMADSAGIAKTHKELSVLYREQGSFEEGINNAFAALNYFESKNDSLNIADALRMIASIFHLTKNMEGYKTYLFRAKRYLNPKKNNELFVIVLKEIAYIARDEGKIDSSLMLLKYAAQTEMQVNNLIGYAVSQIGIGNTLMRIDSVDAALRAFRDVKEIGQTHNLDRYLSHALHSIGEVYYAIYQYDSAIIYLNQASEMAKKINYSIVYERSLLILFQVYEEQGDYKKALNYYKAYDAYSDSLRSEKVKLNIAELQTKYETFKREQEILQLHKEKELQQSKELLLKTLIIGIVLVSLLIIILFWQKRMKEKKLHQQRELFHEQEKALATAEMEKRKLKEEELRQSVQYKSKQLSTHALHMMQKNKMLQGLQANLKLIAKNATVADKQSLKQVNYQINQSLLSDKEWDIFKLYFEEVNRDFYQKLLDISPELTNYEQRLCALIKLNMNSHEMASVLNISPNSVKSARYRLKKKLGLDAEDDLEAFIRRIE